MYINRDRLSRAAPPTFTPEPRLPDMVIHYTYVSVGIRVLAPIQRIGMDVFDERKKKCENTMTTNNTGVVFMDKLHLIRK